MKRLVRKVINWFSEIINACRYRIATVQLDYAVYQAEKMHSLYGTRYYVIPDTGRKLTVLNRQEFRSFRRANLIDETKRIKDIMKTSFYFTADRGGKQILRPVDIQAKRETYFKWYFNGR